MDKHWPFLGDADSAREQLRLTFKTAAMSCFDVEIFRNKTLPAGVEVGRDTDIELHRAILYERVVHPLKKVISDMGWDTSLDAFEAIDLNDSRKADGSTYIPPPIFGSQQGAVPEQPRPSSTSNASLDNVPETSRDTPRSDQASLPQSNCNRSLSPAIRKVAIESSQLKQQGSPAFYKAALFDDDMPTDGHTPERYVYATSVSPAYCPG
jgi:hypothetical protein